MEKFLQSLWARQAFSHEHLFTLDGQALQIYQPGLLNHHAGPDFQNARIKIGILDWFGSVEIHKEANEWFYHRHQHNELYNSTILHVVFSNKNLKPAHRSDGSHIPTLHLSPTLLNASNSTIQSSSCATIPKNPFSLYSLLEQKAQERYLSKQQYYQKHFQSTYHHNPEHLALAMLFQALFAPQNQLPAQLLLKAITSGLLPKIPKILWSDLILYLSGLLPFIPLPITHYLPIIHHFAQPLAPSLWHTGKYRPQSAPLLRLAWIAQILSTIHSPISSLLSLHNYQAFRTQFDALPPVFHIAGSLLPFQQFKSGYSPGATTLSSIFINAVIPYNIWLAHRNGLPTSPILNELTLLPPEHNFITKALKQQGYPPLSHAMHSQGAIHLHHNHCSPVLCSNCPFAP
jgi:hypothetical protein